MTDRVTCLLCPPPSYAASLSCRQAPPTDKPGADDPTAGSPLRTAVGASSTSPLDSSPTPRERAALRAMSAASAEVRSPLRLYVLSYLSGVLALLAVNGEPAPPCLLGCLVACSSVRERDYSRAAG